MLKCDSEKNYEFEKTTTNIGATATISSNNTNSNIILNADKDINIMGADILAKEDNSNITLNAGNDINISTIQDYEYERQYSKIKGGTFGTTTTREDITQSLTNINSNITASNNLSITTGNNLTSIGTNFTAGATTSNHSPLEGESNEQGLDRSSFGGGSITFNIGNDLNLYNAMDYNYEYHYEKKEKFDLGSALANVGAAVAVGAMFPGVGAAVVAGISSGIGASQMTKGSIDITTNYDETTIANKLTSNNINIRTGNNLNSVSTIINDTTIDTVDTLMNLNNIKFDIGNGIGIAVAEEKHEHEHIHDTWGGDIGRAALGGAITGLVTGVSMQAGKFAGKYLSGLVDNAVSGTLGTALTEATNASVNAAIMSTMNTVGTAMANTTIYGGNFKDVLKSGRDSLRDKDNLKSIAVSTLGAGITTSITTKLNIVKPTTFTDKLTKNVINGATNTALQSTINGDSFKDTLKHQVVNSLVMTGAEYGANAIGSNYYNGNINKAEQLILHAGLGAVSSKLTGGDYLSGAVSGVVGELTAELIGEKYYDGKDSLTDKQRQNITNISGLLSGLSAIVVAKSQGKDVKDIGNEAFAGQRVGQNAAQNNYLYPHEKKSLLDELDKCNGDGACKKEVQNKYKKISDKRDKEFNKILLYGSVEDLENIHYDLRDKLTKEGNEYYNSLSKEDREKEFIKLPDSASIYHTFQQDEKGNVINVLTGAEKGYVKLVHPKYGYEVVLDGNGNIVTNPVNMGTYNFYNPKLDGVESNPLINGNFNHVLYDVLPYYKLGNSKKDPTIGSDRIIRNLNILFNK